MMVPRRIIGKAPRPKGWRTCAEHSLSKLYMVRPDESTEIRFSLDWPGAFSGVRDQAVGIRRLQALIMTPERKNHKVAIIYDVATNERLLVYRRGILETKNIKV
jgi:hypothetical protein